MALNFPDTTGQPTNGTFTHTENGTTWSWDGVKWTSKPSGKFTDGSESAPSISFDADQDTGIFSAAANELGFSTGGSRKLTIDSAGNVGIGTNSPTNATLHVEGRNFAFGGPGYNSSGESNLYLGDYNAPANNTYDPNIRVGTRDEFQFEIESDYGNGTRANHMLFASPTAMGYNIYGDSSSPGSIFYYNYSRTVADQYMFFGVGGTPRLRITGSGNVGIGTDNPTQKLVVKGDGDGIRIEDGSATDGYNIIRHDPTGFLHFVGDQTSFSGYRFFTNDNYERLTILNNGAIGLGTSSPREVLHVNGNIALGGSETGNYITFKGTTGDGGDASQTAQAFNMTWIGERIWGGTEKSELLLMKGNDVQATAGPDRIRHVGGEHVFEVYEQGEWVYSDSFESNGANADYDEAMVIKPSGNIRKPMQCVVQIANTNAFNTGYAAQEITNQYDSERADVGNNYNTSTGIFTAPETGYYKMYHQMSARSADGILEPKIYVNGTERVRSYTEVDNNSKTRTVAAQGIHYLVAGDTVQPYYHWSNNSASAYIYGNSSVHSTHFSIYFLQ